MNTVVVVERQPTEVGLLVWVLFGPVIVAGVLLYLLFVGVRALWRLYRAWVAARAQNRANLAARADQQHAWVLAGDPRGTYGY